MSKARLNQHRHEHAHDHRDLPRGRSHLTFREREVLRRICAGESDRQIAENLGISNATARTHARSILLKLGVGTRAAAAAVMASVASPLTASSHARIPDPDPAPVSRPSPGPPSSPPPSPSPPALTAREAEVLHCFAAGLTQPAIAHRLVVSPHTVRTHIRNLLAKLGLHSVNAAAALVRQAP
jgi:DNA-binding NarL/FixJ family response regulator